MSAPGSAASAPTSAPGVTSPAASPWASVGVSPPSRPARPRRRPWWEVAISLAVAAGVVATLLWSGVIVLHPAGPTVGVSFSSARSSALASASNVTGGPWSLVVSAVGLDVGTAANVSTANVTGLLGANCTPTPLAHGSPVTELFVPRFSGAFSSGLASFWLVVLENTTHDGFLAVEVNETGAEPFALLSGASCLPTGGSAKTLPAGVVNSPEAANVAWSSYGSSIVAVDPNLTAQVLVAFPGGTFEGVQVSGAWAVVYAPCDPFLGGSDQEVGFVAAIGLTSAFPLDSFSVNVSCPG